MPCDLTTPIICVTNIGHLTGILTAIDFGQQTRGIILKRIVGIVLFAFMLAEGTNCRADGTCDDWVDKGGYCVDYVKSKMPTFPVPKDVAAITLLNNKASKDVAQGDVAIFDLGKYWHVAFIEKVHVDQRGNATAIDVSEMNFGGRLSLNDYKKKWRSKNRSEWKRAISCGVTKKYGQTGKRTRIALSSVDQIWSPVVAASQVVGDGKTRRLLDKIREALNDFLDEQGS